MDAHHVVQVAREEIEENNQELVKDRKNILDDVSFATTQTI